MLEKSTEQNNEKELLNVSRMYYDICYASCYGNRRGISVKELKSKYKLKKRDIDVFAKLIAQYDIIYDNASLAYSIYRFNSKNEVPDESISYADLYDEVEDVDVKDIDNNCFIRIEDYVTVLQKKIDGETVDITNVAFVKEIGEKVSELWNSISDEKLTPEYIVDKKASLDIPEHILENKREWVSAIVRCCQAEVTYCIGGDRKIKKEKVYPVGQYYDRFLEEYKCVYTLDDKKYSELELGNIHSVRICSDSPEMESKFNIDEYIHTIQKEKMVLKVFHEGKVNQKWKGMLCDNQLKITEYQEYDLFEFMTDDPWEYFRIINGHGRSVVVVEPQYLRDNIYETAKKALAYYQKLSDYS